MPRSPGLWSRNFALLWQGNTVSLLGTQVYLISVVLWTKEATGSSTLVGTLMMAGGLAAFLGPLGGTLADRYDRARVLVVLDMVSGSLILSLVAMFLLFPDGAPLLIGGLFVIQILRGTCDSFFLATVTAVVPDIVPGSRLGAANSWLQASLHVSRLLGFGLGGVLFRVLGAPVLFLIDGISFLLSALSESFIRLPPKPARPAVPWMKGLAGFARETAEGFRYTLAHTGLRVYLVAATAANFFQSAFIVLLPFYASDVLGAKVDWYGYLAAGFATGMLPGVVAGGVVRLRGRGRIVVPIACIAVSGLCQAGLALVGAEEAALALQVVAGFGVGFWVVFMTATLQAAVETEVRGRVMGVIQAFRWGLIPLGMGFFGLMADLLGRNVPFLFLLCGSVIAVAPLLAATQPGFRALLAGITRARAEDHVV